MLTNGKDTIETLSTGASLAGRESVASGRIDETRSMPTKGRITQETELQMPISRTKGAYGAIPIAVSELQFLTMKEETLVSSLNLLNSCGSALLSAMESIPPHPESGRTMGEGSGHTMRKLAKSVCDIIHTKFDVIRQIQSIVRDE